MTRAATRTIQSSAGSQHRPLPRSGTEALLGVLQRLFPPSVPSASWKHAGTPSAMGRAAQLGRRADKPDGLRVPPLPGVLGGGHSQLRTMRFYWLRRNYLEITITRQSSRKR